MLNLRKALLLAGLLVLFARAGRAQAPLTTTISDTIYTESGSPQQGSLVISNPRFTSPDGFAISASTQTVNLNGTGHFSVNLVPTFGATPAGTLYTVQIVPLSGPIVTEQWNVPYFATPLFVSQVIVTGPGTPIPPLAGDVIGSYLTSQVIGLHFGSAPVTLNGNAPVVGDCLGLASNGASFTFPCSGGSGSVTSVGLSLPAQFTVTGSPVTGTGTLTAAWASQAQDLVLASPCGSSGTPGFRSICVADLPALPNSSLQNSSITINAPSFMSGWGTIALGGSISPAWLSESANTFLRAPNGVAGVPFFGAIVAADIPAGTNCTSGLYANGIGAALVPSCAQVAYSQLSGAPTLFYQQVQSNAANQTQRNNLNFSTNFSVSDSAPNSRTSIDLATPISSANVPAINLAGGGNGGVTGLLPNASLVNSTITINSQTVSLGATGNIPFETNGTNLTSLAGLNFINSTVNAVGLAIAASNPGTNQVKFEITGSSYSGNAATATGLSTTGANGTFWGVSGGVQGWFMPAGTGSVNNCSTAFSIAYYAAAGTTISCPGSVTANTGQITIGTNGLSGVTGQLLLNVAISGGAAITVQNGGATAAYNFNLPISAGTSGFVLASGGGGSAAMTWTQASVTVNGQSCSLASTCTIPFQTNTTNNTSQAGLNFITSTVNSIGGTITPSNPVTNQVKFELGGIINATGGGSGLSNPTTHSFLVTEGSSNFNLVTSPSVNGYYLCGFNVTLSAAVDPNCALPGIQVNAQSGNYTLLFSDRAGQIRESGGNTATITLPQIAGNFAADFPFMVPNFNVGTLTFQANANDIIDGGALGGSTNIPPKFVSFVYQDASSAPGHWWTVNVPMFAAFTSCFGTNQAVNFNPTSNPPFGCTTISGGGGGGATGDINQPILYTSRTIPVGLSTTAQVGVTNTASATSLVGTSFVGRKTILAGTMLAGGSGVKTLSFLDYGTISTAGSNFSLTLTFLLGGQTLGSVTVPTIASLSGAGFDAEFDFTIVSATTVNYGGCVNLTGTSNAALKQCISGTASGLNFATDQLLDVQATWGTASSSNSLLSNLLVIRPAF